MRDMARVNHKRSKSRPGPKSTVAAKRRVSSNPDEGDSLETRILSFARKGRLKRPANEATKSQLDAGLSIVYQSGKRIVREHPDGTLEIVSTLSSASQPVPERFRSFVVSKSRKRK